VKRLKFRAWQPIDDGMREAAMLLVIREFFGGRQTCTTMSAGYSEPLSTLSVEPHAKVLALIAAAGISRLREAARENSAHFRGTVSTTMMTV